MQEAHRHIAPEQQRVAVPYSHSRAMRREIAKQLVIVTIVANVKKPLGNACRWQSLAKERSVIAFSS